MPCQLQRDSAHALAHALWCCALPLSAPRLALMAPARRLGTPYQKKGVLGTQADKGTARTMIQADPLAAACLELRRHDAQVVWS